MKTTSLILTFSIIFLANIDCQIKPTIYPGAVQMYSESNSYFLSKDDYSKVRAYYAREINDPRPEANDGSPKTVFFVYLKQLPDDGGVYITELQGGSNVPETVFSRLRGLVIQGIITQERVNQIEQKYSHLKNYYFVNTRDERGRYQSADRLIFNKYETKIGAGGTEAMNNEEIMKKYMEYVNAGKMQEGIEFMKRAQEQMKSNIETALSPQAADIWVECLEEIASQGYPVRISISM